jgi:oxalate decarboxylase/phosphoglucose isomerase-like protein (cupin superfamily)|tara:strand:- start:2223 stop:2696 length:474 start_codon:yes stop_codon:yes gene_type:complete
MNQEDKTKSKKMVDDVLLEYKEKIDGKKDHELNLSNYKVTKPWGHELWLELNEFYAYKLIHMKEGNQSSLQMHEMKIEANYVIDGTAEVLLEDENGELKSHIYSKGSGWVVPRKRKHRVIAKTDYTAMEVSTPHLDDVIRFEDDMKRKSGKIKEEHI